MSASHRTLTLHSNLVITRICKYCKMQAALYKHKTTLLPPLNPPVDHPLHCASIEHFCQLGSCCTVMASVMQTSLVCLPHSTEYIQLLSHWFLRLLAVWGKDQLVFRYDCCLVTVLEEQSTTRNYCVLLQCKTIAGGKC